MLVDLWKGGGTAVESSGRTAMAEPTHGWCRSCSLGFDSLITVICWLMCDGADRDDSREGISAAQCRWIKDRRPNGRRELHSETLDVVLARRLHRA